MRTILLVVAVARVTWRTPNRCMLSTTYEYTYGSLIRAPEGLR